uniref:HMG box domain-containing protein n=1 Tax=Globodera pallida TaxID=36090 RepID=A0A183BVL3_GLOPA
MAAGRLLIGPEARFFVRTYVTNISTTLHRSCAHAPIPARLSSHYNAPAAFALFIKEYMTEQGGGAENYLQSAKKIDDELRDQFEKLTDDQKKALSDKHVEERNKFRKLKNKMELRKFCPEKTRPKQPLSSYKLFINENLEKQTESYKTEDEEKKFFDELVQQWRQMTDAEKKPYVDQALSNTVAYYMEVMEWEQKYVNEIPAWKVENSAKIKALLKARKPYVWGAVD